MKKMFAPLLFLLSSSLFAQNVGAYFQRIRNDAAALTAFFSAMPKGGDLHHHFSGAVYGETFLQTAIEKGFWVNTRTLALAESKPANALEWVSLGSLDADAFEAIKEKLLQFWSVKDYNGTTPPPDQFFNSFGHFGPAANYSLVQGLKEIKERAKTENVSYIETSLRSVWCQTSLGDSNGLTNRLILFGKEKDQARLLPLLDSLWMIFKERNIACVASFKNSLHNLHRTNNIDDPSFAMRFQSAVNRNVPPVQFFSNLVAAFQTADDDSLIVGVNILAPEHYETAMRDYWLHMQMFRFLHTKLKGIKCSLHAGELTLGLVKPEDLTTHINEAVYTAGAARIGHGVDLPYEKEADLLLAKMKKDSVAIEVNLTSNEFILGVKDDRHPLLLYKAAGVPIVISTDDAGILRTSLTDQFVLLAKRYPSVSYADIKGFVFNSINRSFINQKALKEKLRLKLAADFKTFEQKILRTMKSKRHQR